MSFSVALMPGWKRLCMRSKIVVRNEFGMMGRNFPVLVSPSNKRPELGIARSHSFNEVID